MRLQANYHGAWQNVALPDTLTFSGTCPQDAQLKLAGEITCPEAHGLRITDGQDDHGRPRVLWLWYRETGWRRPHWYRDEV